MIKVILGHLLQLILVLLIIFGVTQSKLVQGSPLSVERQVAPAMMAKLNECYYGLDNPLW